MSYAWRATGTIEGLERIARTNANKLRTIKNEARTAQKYLLNAIGELENAVWELDLWRKAQARAAYLEYDFDKYEPNNPHVIESATEQTATVRRLIEHTAEALRDIHDNVGDWKTPNIADTIFNMVSELRETYFPSGYEEGIDVPENIETSV